MKTVPTLFFATGACFALLGMIWGIQMSATGDHSLSPAHGHLNLVGFVTMSIMGIYYALTPAAATSKWAMPHYLLTVVSVVILVPGIVMALSENGEVLAKAGSALAVLSMLTFLAIILKLGFGEKA
ncbi:MAG: hypothetical protein L3J65_00025 [Robiginitomaculum sp.]|nr:hypothetical protein [Robiginitomaculum sp.]